MAEVVLMLEKRIPVGNPPPPFPNWRPSSSNQTSELMVIQETYSDADESSDISSTTVDATHDTSINASKEEHKKEEHAEDSDNASSKSIKMLQTKLLQSEEFTESDIMSSTVVSMHDLIINAEEEHKEEPEKDSDNEKATSNFSNEISKDLDNTSSESIDPLQIRLFDKKEVYDITFGFCSRNTYSVLGLFYGGRFPNGVQIDVKIYYDDTGKKIVETLSRTAHPNIIRLYGHCFDGDQTQLVYEHVGDRTLDTILHQDHPISFEWVKLYDVAIQIAKGVAYLHNRGIVHNGIIPSSMLLDHYFSLKIAYFDRANFIKSDDAIVHEPKDRPSMREVLIMLERKEPVEAPPDLFLGNIYRSREDDEEKKYKSITVTSTIGEPMESRRLVGEIAVVKEILDIISTTFGAMHDTSINASKEEERNKEWAEVEDSADECATSNFSYED
ncbi:Pr5-like receptor kinase [Thalictrum thalictroides]|uniref:non-specific serine/threonine protein kinase n=1 Tax=Thalictrum thalictroides TaxID=46969 RepID=A0A7J6WLS6_THATH|nr:Pr5-like receptor kinase [Thalictrum thalictroides]